MAGPVDLSRAGRRLGWGHAGLSAAPGAEPGEEFAFLQSPRLAGLSLAGTVLRPLSVATAARYRVVRELL